MRAPRPRRRQRPRRLQRHHAVEVVHGAHAGLPARGEQAVADALGHPTPTTEFLLGTMEDLAALGIQEGSVDVVISNCVLNLAPDKAPVFAEIDRVLWSMKAILDQVPEQVWLRLGSFL